MTGERQDAVADAFLQRLVQEHGAALLTYANRFTGDYAAAEDLVQEALLRAWQHAPGLREGPGSVRGWLMTVVRNLAVDRDRARRARPAEVAAPPAEAPAAVAADHADRVLDSVVVDAALAHLPAAQRRVVEYVYLRGHTVTETASALGIPPGTVKSRAHHAIRVLRTALPRPAAARRRAC